MINLPLPKLKLKRLSFFLVTIGLVIITPSLASTQEEPILPDSNNSVVQTTPGLYFADVLVRGRPIFQIGSLPEISASERAEIINRRIASVIAQTENLGQVTTKPDNPRQIATIQLNNRVLMTVTNQDAEDFGIEIEDLADRWAKQLNQALNKPPLAIDVGQRLYETVRELVRNTIDHLPSLVGAIIVIGVTWGAATGVRYVAFRWAQQTEGDPSTEILIGRLSYGGVWLLGIFIALGVMGLDFGALLGALGLTSVAIGFSLKDVLSNYISGIILLSARPFKINDQVIIADYEGTITQIQLRATTMKTYDGRLVYIPNQEVFQASIINNTASPRRRSSVLVGIDYSEDIEQAKQVISSAVNSIKEVEREPAPNILVLELAASTVNLEIRFWVDSRRSGFLATTSQVSQAVKEALGEANIDMPTDIYTLILREFPTQIKIKSEEAETTPEVIDRVTGIQKK